MLGAHKACLRAGFAFRQYQRHGGADVKLVEAMTRDTMPVKINLLPVIQGDEAVIRLGFQSRDPARRRRGMCLHITCLLFAVLFHLTFRRTKGIT